MARRKSVPALTPDSVDDDRRLGDALHALLELAPRMRQLSKSVRRSEAELRRRVDQQAWTAYLCVEGQANGRYDEGLRLVARWAFHQGAKAVLRPQSGGRSNGEPRSSATRRRRAG